MRRVVGSLVVACTAAAVVVGVGTASRAPQVRQQNCPFTRSPAPGWQATFGHAASATAADALRARAAKVGFTHLVTQPACEGGFEVALRGICPLRVARSLQTEARRAHFSVVLEYKKPMDPGPDLVVVFGHFHTRAGADAFVPRVESRGYTHVTVYQDGGCNNDWEVLVGGLTSRSQAADLENEARRSGFDATVEYA
jgi:hypothetical protein